MATNQFLNNPEWKTIATVSTPTVGFRKIFAKTGLDNYYIMNDQGNEKEIAITNLYRNGLVSTPLSPTNPYRNTISLSLGQGLTFSSDSIGSSVSVFGLVPNMLQSVTGSVDGYILSVTGSGGVFEWLPFVPPGTSGTVNRIAKFNTSSSVGNSLLTDDGSKVFIGNTPSVSVKFGNDGNQYVGAKLYFDDTINNYIQYQNGFTLSTTKGFSINSNLGYNYLSFTTDDIGFTQSTYNLSLLNSTLQMSDLFGSRNLSINGLKNLLIGTTSASYSINIFATSSVLRIQDGSQGSNKVFVSDATGLGSWINLTNQYISFAGITNSLVKFDGNGGLTHSSIYEMNQNVGIGISFNQGLTALSPLHLQVNATNSQSRFVIHNTNTTNNNGDAISFRTNTNSNSFIEYAAIQATYENHTDSSRLGSLSFFTRNGFISYTQSLLTLNLQSDGTVFIPGTQSGSSALRFGSLTSLSPAISSNLALSVDSTGRVVLANISTTGNLMSPFDKGLTANSVTINGGTASNSVISRTPVQGSYVSVFINGQEIEVGNGTTNSSCYFGTQSNSPRGFSASNAIQSGDYLYWNPSIAGFNLESGWRISFHYLIP